MLSGLLKKIFGDKNTKAMNEISPIVNLINTEYEKIKDLTDAELIGKTTEFKERLQEGTSELRNQIEELKEKLKSDELEEDRHSIYDQLDSLEDQLDEKYEEILDEILPEAFAVVKEDRKSVV